MISVVVITLNEADRILALLKSAAFADEVIVVDSGSTDGTRELCGAGGARVITHPWQGFAKQKQYAMELASFEWILNLDADERISDPLAAELREMIRDAPPEVCGFSMPRLSRYLGTWIRHGGWYPDRKVRLVRKGCGQWKGGGLHEKLEVSGKIQSLSSPILHEVYRNISDQVATINRFSDVYAEEHAGAGAWFTAIGVFHALGKFLECYLWKLGALDGTAGLVIAMNSAWYVFLKHAKVWEKGLNYKES
ncbi:MAG: glycosyltransferase family 2 protein [Deltaproteobacteria bacterium]|nr:glycosyltransferase family 2 protein [Deltaproteobacteria bacterium]